jgi:hypothetical protein
MGLKLEESTVGQEEVAHWLIVCGMRIVSEIRPSRNWESNGGEVIVVVDILAGVFRAKFFWEIFYRGEI